jgi:ribosomal protein S18 acetylase RimI-like enzyme
MQVRVLQKADARLYQQLRLSALATDPEAFGSSYEREAAFASETVAERLRPYAGKFALGAFDGEGVLVGIVTFIRDSGVKTSHKRARIPGARCDAAWRRSNPKGNVYGMYVTPQMRGRGVGKTLLLELIGRARACDGVEQLGLSVVAANDGAMKLYESVGFEAYGVERRALKWGEGYYE